MAYQGGCGNLVCTMSQQTNVKVESNKNESTSNLLRRFSRRVRYSGILNKKRGLRYRDRPASNFGKKKEALRKKRRREEVDKLIKLGKLPDHRRSHDVLANE